MKKYKYLLWDLDGTIINSFEGITRSFAYALESYGIKVNDYNELRPVLGPPLRDAFMDMYGFDEEKAIEAVEKYRERYTVKFLEESEVYPGIDVILQKLCEEGFHNVLATAKPEKFAGALLDHFDLSRYFSFITGATMDKSRDSKEKVLQHIISELGIADASQAVMIGDRKYDLCGADAFGIDGIGVLYGFGSEEELKSCPHVFLAKSADEVYNYISKF